MPKNSRPDSNQMAALLIAKASGEPVPERLKKFAPLVKKTKRKRSNPTSK